VLHAAEDFVEQHALLLQEQTQPLVVVAQEKKQSAMLFVRLDALSETALDGIDNLYPLRG
jgi:hypothetical protein